MLGSNGKIDGDHLNFAIEVERNLSRHIIKNNLDCPYDVFKQLVETNMDGRIKILDDLESKKK
jgi:hypothetical protein